MMTVSGTFSGRRGSSARPIVGVCVMEETVRGLHRPAANMLQEKLVSGLVEANRKAGTTLYFFSGKEVSYAAKTIMGSFYNERKKRWEKRSFPFPDVLYDQGMDPKTKEKFDRLGIRKINARSSLNKWELHKILRENRRLAPHLPYTEHCRNITVRALRKAFKRARSVYVKACIGGSGTKVMRVRKGPDGYEYRYFVNRLFAGKAGTLEELLNVIRKVMQKRELIIQEEIPLLRMDGRLLDLRAEVHRNGKGELEILAVFVRVGRKNSPISTFGEHYMLDTFFAQHADSVPLKIHFASFKKELHSLIARIFETVEKAYGPFGEMGVDLALDNKGNLWFIECNAKTLKVAFHRLCDAGTKRRAFQNILEYARRISDGGRG